MLRNISEGILKKRVFLVTMFLGIMLTFTSCNKTEKSNVDITTSAHYTKYNENQMLMIILSQIQDIQNTYTDKIWDRKLDSGNTTYRTVFIGEMKNFFKELRVLNLIAEEKGVRLTTEEEAKAGQAAKEYFDIISKSQGSLQALSHVEIDQMYKEYALALKTKEEVTKEEVDSVSEDEARILKLQQIVVDSKEKAEKVETQLQEPNIDFYTVARQNSESPDITIVVGHKDLCTAADKAVCELKDGEISQTIEDKGKFYIYKCIDGYDEEATAKKKATIKKQKREDALRVVYNEYLSRNELEVEPVTWKEVNKRLETEFNINTAKNNENSVYNFFSLYAKEF